MEKTILEIITQTGISGVSILILAALFWHIHKNTTEMHKTERDEWRKDAKEGREQTDKVIKEFTEVIRANYSNKP